MTPAAMAERAIPSNAYPESGSLTQEVSYFDRRPRLRVVVMVVLFFLAGAFRLYNLKAPGILVDREYVSAIFARDFYFEHTESIEAWRKEVAHVTRRNQPILEPPVTEYLVSLLYRAAGGERLWLARPLTSAFWLVGGIFLYRIAKRLVSTDAAIVGTAYYLFVPLGVLTSRSFQPDALMMLFFLASLFSMIGYMDMPSMPRLVAAASISGLALLIRPLILFTLFGAFIALVLQQSRTWKRVIDRRFLIFLVVSLLPAVLYYGYGIFIAGYLRWKVDTSFSPYLFLHRVFWKDWLLLGVDSVGFTALMGALLGAPMLRKGIPRALLAGLAIGYVVFGLVFNFHIHTHDYYHVQLIPLVAFSIGPIATLITGHLRRLSYAWYWYVPIGGALLLGILFSIRAVRGRLASQVIEGEETSRKIGQIVHHSTETVFLSRHYGIPLQYQGELSGAYWPRRITSRLYRGADERELSIEERLNTLGFSPEFFIITHFSEYHANHSDLKEYLERYCSLLAASDKYLIYHLCAR